MNDRPRINPNCYKTLRRQEAENSKVEGIPLKGRNDYPIAPPAEWNERLVWSRPWQHLGGELMVATSPVRTRYSNPAKDMSDDLTKPSESQIESDSPRAWERLSMLIEMGDPDTWNRLVNTYSPLVYDWCRKKSVPADICPDVVQEVFLSVAKNIHQFRAKAGKSSFVAWLKAITHCRIVDFHRKNQACVLATGGTSHLLRIQEIENPQIEPSELSLIRYAEVLRALDELHIEPATKQIFIDVMINEKRYEEVAKENNMTTNAAHIAVFRVRRKLREAFSNNPEWADLFQEDPS